MHEDQSAAETLPEEPKHDAVPEPDGDAIADDLFCPGCGYNLRGLTAERCPECGRAFDRDSLAVSRIPWVHRAQTGRFTAYWRTVFVAMFASRVFCDEVLRPVAYRDAQRFRWVTIAHVYGALVAGATFVYAREVAAGGALLGTSALDALAWTTGLVATFLYLAAITGVPSYFFHPRTIPVSQQNRAIALSYYACAGLAWAPVTVGVALVAIALLAAGSNTEAALGTALAWTSIVMVLVQVLAWWFALNSLARRALDATTARRLAIEIGVPLLWLALAVPILLGIPAVVGFVAIVVSSLG